MSDKTIINPDQPLGEYLKKTAAVVSDGVSTYYLIMDVFEQVDGELVAVNPDDLPAWAQEGFMENL